LKKRGFREGRGRTCLFTRQKKKEGKRLSAELRETRRDVKPKGALFKGIFLLGKIAVRAGGLRLFKVQKKDWLSSTFKGVEWKGSLLTLLFLVGKRD